MIDKQLKIYIAGHRGMVGSAINNLFVDKGYKNIITASKDKLDLTNQATVDEFMFLNKPDIVILAAAKVGGINANINNPANFLYDNLMIQNNVIHSAWKHNVSKFVFLGSSCIYPKECLQPMKEEYLLSGKLEPTNEGYALAKIAGLKLLEFYKKQYNFNSLSLMPCNLYGPNDSFDAQNSHVLSALVKKFVDAKDNNEQIVTLWGSGIARREFMHVFDLAEAVFFLLKNYNSSNFINVGSGYDVSIKELSEIISRKCGFNGQIKWDLTKPDGMLRKCLDISEIEKLGFKHKIHLEFGIDEMINNYKKSKSGL